MKTYKSTFPEITLKLKKGETLNCQIKTSKDAADLFRQIWDVDTLQIYESVIVIFLNRCNNTIGWYKVSQGGLSGSVIDVRLILATALGCLASGIIMCHNHPSGNLNPSEQDTKITMKIKQAATIMDMQLLDHIILTEENYYSFQDDGII
jgi:DNA repair protein RadC